jgi:hypothetical protein
MNEVDLLWNHSTKLMCEGAGVIRRYHRGKQKTPQGLPLWYLLVTPVVSSDYSCGIFWLPLWYLLITPVVSSGYPCGVF